MRSATTSPRRTRRGLTLAAASLALVVGTCFALLEPPSFAAPYSTVVFARDGSLIAASVASDGQWRFPSGGHIPERYVKALLAFEDERFYAHPGIDPVAVARAVIQNLKAGRVVSGASTITMQVVRLSRPSAPRSFVEKGVEAMYALRLEAAADKDAILALYAAHAPFGGNTVGLEAACWRYFGREPESLTWAEAALLAVLPNSPALIHPGRNRDRLRQKRDGLLRRLHDEGELDASTLELALAEPLPGPPGRLPQLSPHLLARAAGSRLETTLDSELQRRSLEVLERHQALQARNGVHNLAAVVVDNRTGEVLAYHGNVLADGAHEDYVDVASAPRSTGSLLKPFLYEALFDAGDLLPDQLVSDVPLRIGGFSPQNFDRTFEGAVPASEALARSLNVPATLLLREYGVDPFYARLKALGLTTLTRASADYGLSLVLGGAEGSLVDLVGAYGGLARAASGEVEPLFAPRLLRGEPTRTWAGPVGAASSYLTLKAMLEVKRPGADGAWRLFSSSRKVSWKTGTSFGHRDAWAIGTTADVTVGVWVGNADGEGRPGLTGVVAAAPVLFDLFELLPRGEWFDVPRNVEVMSLCADSGYRAGPDCAAQRAGLSTPAGKTSAQCPHCRTVSTDAKGFRVHGDCESVFNVEHRGVFALPPTEERYFKRIHPGYAGLPPWRSDCKDGETAGAHLALIHPRPGTELYVPVELDGSRGRAVFEAAHHESAVAIHWHLDEAFLGTTRTIHQLEVSPAPGEHRLVLVDEHGERLERTFRVLDPS